MGIDRVLGHPERPRNLGVRHALCRLPQNRQLASTQAVNRVQVRLSHELRAAPTNQVEEPEHREHDHHDNDDQGSRNPATP